MPFKVAITPLWLQCPRLKASVHRTRLCLGIAPFNGTIIAHQSLYLSNCLLCFHWPGIQLANPSMPTSEPRLQPLPYLVDSAIVFSCVADFPWAVFLDSGFPESQQGRYDIIAANPIATLETYGNVTKITRTSGVVESLSDPFELVRQELARFNVGAEGEGLPFTGGAMGYFAYDLARRLEKLPVFAVKEDSIADMAVGIYRWAVVVDHYQRQTVLAGQGLTDPEWQDLMACLEPCAAVTNQTPFQVNGPIISNMDKVAYGEGFKRIKHYLKEGDCYQVNFAQRFSASCAGDPWQAYLALRCANPAPFSAYLNFSGVQVLSSSPERFLKLKDGRVETKPIKGTLPRKSNPVADKRQMDCLRNCGKNRAENLMIVDLLRNDLGKTCQSGSVRVPKLFQVESYATVHHLVSTVTGVLAAGFDALDLLRSCFPGGSITGAPKIRAMEIIEELEPHRRGVYCGAIGYIGFDGNMDTNIAIRTMQHTQGSIRFWAGGGVVNDSTLDDEYQECFDKAAAMMSVLQGFRAR